MSNIDFTKVITAADKFQQLIDAKVAEIDLWYKGKTGPMINGYPDSEKLSWGQQSAEATAYQADNSAPTPLLTFIAQGRGITVAELVPKVLQNVEMFTQAGALMGKRQALRDAAQNAKTQADLDTVVIPVDES